MSSALLQQFRFILVGTINTFAGLSVIFAAKGIMGLDDYLSNILGYGFGLLISFFFNKKWTFTYAGRTSTSAVKFIAAFLFAYLANLITVYWFRDVFGWNSYSAQAIGIVPYTLIFYLTCRYYVFPNNHISETS